MKYRHFIFGILLIASAALLAPGCGKIVDPAEDPEKEILHSIFFTNPAVNATETKTVTNKTIGENYDDNESFRIFALFHLNRDSFGNSAEYFPDTGVTCSRHATDPTDHTNDYWEPTTPYYWPVSGYLSFLACSPDIAGDDMTAPDATTPALEHSWSTGFTFHDFTIRGAGAQYDLLYTDFILNCKRTDYTGSPYDDSNSSQDEGYTHKGVNILFKHSLSLIEFQIHHRVEAGSFTYNVLNVTLLNAYKTGTFNQNYGVSSAQWTGQKSETDYALFNNPPSPGITISSTATQIVDLAAREDVNTLMLLPQDLTHGSVDPADHVWARVTYTRSDRTDPITGDPIEFTPVLDLATSSTVTEWTPGMKYVYHIYLNSAIQFSATMEDWIEYRGSYTIVN